MGNLHFKTLLLWVHCVTMTIFDMIYGFKAMSMNLKHCQNDFILFQSVLTNFFFAWFTVNPEKTGGDWGDLQGPGGERCGAREEFARRSW